MRIFLFLIISLFFSLTAFSDTPAPGKVSITSGTLSCNAGTGTFQSNITNSSLPVTQSGTWNINNITGTVTLPTGAGTAANQSTIISSLANIDAGIPASLGQTTMSASMPVTIASNQSAVLTTGTLAATQQGTWSTGRTWTLLNTTDSVNIGNYPANQLVNVSSGTISAQQLGTWNIGSITTLPSIPAGSNAIGSVNVTNGTIYSNQLGTWNVGLNAGVNAIGSVNVTSGTVVVSSVATAANQTNGTEKVQIVDAAGNAIGPMVISAGTNLPIAIGATNYVASTNNSTTAQLASNATFTGTIETVFNQQSFSILITSDQNGTLTINNYIDSGGTRLAQTLTYQITAGVGFARSGVVNGNYFNITFKNTGASTTTTLRVDTAYGTIPSATQLNNGPVALNEVNGTAFNLGNTTPANSLPVTVASVVSANAPIYNVYSSTNITTSAYTQLVASTTLATTQLRIFDSSGQAMILATGASGSEVIQAYIPPGGDNFPLTIPAGTRVAYKALTGTANSGYLIINFLE